MNKEYKFQQIKPGMKYGELTVIGEDLDREEEYLITHTHKERFFKCLCSCGKEVSVMCKNLLSGCRKSCGRTRTEINRENGNKNFIDLTGMKFGNLDVIKLDEEKRGNGAYWICKCNLCGQTKSIKGSYIRSRDRQDCGCQKSIKLSNRARDLTGMKFGNLTVLYRDYSFKIGSDRVRWICRCELCDREESVTVHALFQENKNRCSMCSLNSHGEEKIMQILEENNIPYIHDKTYLDCIFPETNKPLRFDFRIIQNSECDYVIEYDGIQHFRDDWFPRSPLEETIKRDNFKNEWCKNNNIKIIRIPYRRFYKLCIDDLKLETSQYLV